MAKWMIIPRSELNPTKPFMKTKNYIILATSIGGLLFTETTGFSQGSLTPPGAPATTMKTLAQIEPRTPISSAPFTVSSPGSYYLTTNLTGAASGSGIIISANNVTVDLNGFALQGVTSSIDGIQLSDTSTNVTVRNGTISGWGGHGVYFGDYGNASQNLVLEHLTVSANANGIYGANCIVQNCQSSDNSNYGIYVAPGTVSHCLVQNNSGSGIYVNGPGSEVIGNNCVGNNTVTNAYSAAIFINDSRNRIEDNHITGGMVGIRTGGSYNNNVIIRNTVIGVFMPYYMTTLQITGPIIYDTDPSTGFITNSSPWANFQF
jgi:parallel beta-helix repeat protein